MRVAVDVSALTGGLKSGTAVYLYRLVEALAALPDLELRILYNGMPGIGLELAHALRRRNAAVVRAPIRLPLLPGPLFPRPYPAALLREVEAADVFHVGEFVYPRLRAMRPVVATVHDVTTKLYPHWHVWANRLLHRRRLAWISRHATQVIIDAESTRSDTAAALGMPAERLRAIPLARGTPAAPAAGSAAVAEARRHFRLGDAPYVLFVGTLEPRKNLVRLVEAFRRVPRDAGALSLVLAGPWGWRSGELRHAVRQCEAGRAVVATGAVDEATLGALYAGAQIFAYPSLYEGFGLPVLEAMAAGVPVLTSAGGACAEVAGDAAVLVDPASADAIAAGLVRLVASTDERRRFADLGRRREREFSWARTAAATAEVYRRSIEMAA